MSNSLLECPLQNPCSHPLPCLSDGNDGPWSTFNIHVGTPPQPVRVLVSTNVAQTWVVSANKTEGGCLATDPPDCAQARGGLFSANSSTTWQDKEIYQLGIERFLDDCDGNHDNGDYRFDAMRLGLTGSGGVRFDSQTIAAISTKDFYLGHRTNFTSFGDGQVSFLESMTTSGNNIWSSKSATVFEAYLAHETSAAGTDSSLERPGGRWKPLPKVPIPDREEG